MKDIWTGLKDAPLWALIAATIVAVALWQVSPLNAAFPADYRGYLPLAAFALAIFALARIVSSATSIASARRERQRNLASTRLTKLYRPMLALFSDQHLTASSAILAPYVRNRVSNAWEAVRQRRGVIRKAGAAWRALGDKCISTSAEMEYGGIFPLDQIKALVRVSADCADGTLLNLLRQADRSHYEDQPQHSEVTDAEYALAQHIFAEHERLSALTDR
ncbi:hypothetical protein ASE86_09690 [Sphingomonas sp. Leaf33]|uniref:hypothetical protein n=1 Tax=Sphingomonas sp. Leaf33 TaxID=1736215 RepID=UPI0006FDEBE1|nr:hypothetical protein [Sphingomonas sp. Leaf33]KQN26377.1 hypothetical protein ASE86_09690 [Sphingomonas sp. Leaf33]